MNISVKTTKGLDLNIEGAPTGSPDQAQDIKPTTVAITPDDFPGLMLKPSVKEGDTVCCGNPLFHDKTNTSINIVSPACGKVKAIVRGERRKLERIEIEVSDKTYVTECIKIPQTQDSAEIKALLMQTGLWAMMRQRPYNIVPSPDLIPRDIFISLIDTAPLAGDYDSFFSSNHTALVAGVKTLSKLTQGNVYVARKAQSPINDIDGAVMVDVSGPHPAGNVGVIVANVKPVNKGEIIWTIDRFTLLRIGMLFMTGQTDWSTITAVTGSEINHSGYIRTIIGADIKSLITDRTKKGNHHIRLISGNVLSGIKVSRDGYLRYPYTQLTAIPEGDDRTEFMGWASISPKKMSTSRSFPGHFLFKKLFTPDARLLGGRRAMIMSGEYDRVVPMDIMTEYLIKAILSKDIEKMEALGIYEVAPEDFAVAEYVCTSKMPLQSIIADGLEFLRKELE